MLTDDALFCMVAYFYEAVPANIIRAGSVIFLVGVGSLVCWKLWEHWRSGGDSPGCLRPSPPTSPPARRPRGLLASLLEEDLVQDPDDLDDEDPTLIHGKYFGPDSPCGEGPCDEVSLLSTDVSEASEAAAQHYLADASASVSVGDAAPSSSEESLPTDEDSDLELFGGKKRVVKRKHKASELGTPRHGSSTAAAPARTVAPSGGSARHRVENKYGQHSKASHMARHPLQEGWMSSESSPENGPSCLRDLTRLRGDGSETPDSEELVERRRLHMAHSLPGGDLDGSWFTNNRCQPEGEEYQHAAHISSASLSDLMEKMRYRGHRGGSMSRDNSITSNLSEQVTSPLAAKKFPFKREDSVCSNISNISDFALSECSEMSLDVSVHDDLACKTITCLDDIEHELDELKSSMLEMDEEVTKFSSRPNPYSFRTTFSDYSIGSNDSRPSSALDILNNYRSRANFRGLLATKSTASDSEPVDGGVGDGSHTSNQLLSGSEPEGSFEWDSPQHGWTSARAPPLTRLPELPSEDAESSRASVQDDTMPSLEWDNDCLHQYQEDHTATLHDDPLQQVFHQSPQDRQKLLPDHSSLELDMEEELMTSAGPVTEACDLYSAPMTVSIDSAIHSATGSRSTSSSPLPSGMTNSLLSSSGLASSSDISPATPDSGSTSWAGWDRRWGPGELSSKCRRYWSSEESGFVEGPDAPLDTALPAHLSPVHEIKEKECTEGSISPHSCVDNWRNSNSTDNNSNSNSTQVSNSSEGSNSKDTEGSTAAATPASSVDNWRNNNSTEDSKEAADNSLNNNVIMGNKSSSSSDNIFPTPAHTDTAASHGPQGTIVSVGPKVDLVQYANAEWQGNTPKAQLIKQGYTAIPVELNLRHMRRVRGDNYCGVRATLYQVLSLGLPLPSGHATHSRLVTELRKGAIWIRDWTFGNRLKYSSEEILNGFWECLDLLDNMVLNLMGCENRECVVLSHLNQDPDLDIKLCEAIKLHMLAAALDLHTKNNSGDSIPLFAMILFARHSSSTPKDFLKNHLNQVGDTAGLEQIEMFLMGYTLGVTLQVVRPASYGKDDFICYYPDANIGVWPEVTLVAEDDRHYNVLVK